MMLRRRTMGGWGEEESYIQDGLVFWLDGINRGTSDLSKWVDLIGGEEYSTENGDDATWGSNHLVTPCLMRIQNGATVSTYNSTFEIVFQENTGSVNTILYMNRNATYTTGFGFGKYSNNYMLTNSHTLKFTIPISLAPFGNNPYVFSYNGDKLLLINGNKISNIGAADFYNNSDNYCKVATRGNGGKLYCIRKYNRLLTEEEMLHNQQVDNERFNLGINI